MIFLSECGRIPQKRFPAGNLRFFFPNGRARRGALARELVEGIQKPLEIMPPREGTRARHTIPRATRSRDRRSEAHLSSDGRAYDVSGGGGSPSPPPPRENDRGVADDRRLLLTNVSRQKPNSSDSASDHGRPRAADRLGVVREVRERRHPVAPRRRRDRTRAEGTPEPMGAPPDHPLADRPRPRPSPLSPTRHVRRARPPPSASSST